MNCPQIYALGLLHGGLLLAFVWLVWPKNRRKQSRLVFPFSTGEAKDGFTRQGLPTPNGSAVFIDCANEREKEDQMNKDEIITEAHEYFDEVYYVWLKVPSFWVGDFVATHFHKIKLFTK